jgi:hypothetical protein
MEKSSMQNNQLKNWSTPTLFSLDFKDTKGGDLPRDTEDGTYNLESQ